MITHPVTQFSVNGFDKNFTYISSDPDTNEGVVIDPAGDLSEIYTHINDYDITLTAVWLTHTHPDHYDALPELLDYTGALPIYVHETGVQRLHTQEFVTVRAVHEGSQLMVGHTAWQVLHTPGHSPDGCCFYYPGSTECAPHLLSGDTLFVQRCGRTTPTEAHTLYHSLQRLTQLPGNTVVLPGHDYGPTPQSTIAEELEHNSYLNAPDYDTFYAVRFPRD
jgi:glyoxylase-like metal-dependent hydrolase (beta-lactamase superfamily II)